MENVICYKKIGKEVYKKEFSWNNFPFKEKPWFFRKIDWFLSKINLLIRSLRDFSLLDEGSFLPRTFDQKVAVFLGDRRTFLGITVKSINSLKKSRKNVEVRREKDAKHGELKIEKWAPFTKLVVKDFFYYIDIFYKIQL